MDQEGAPRKRPAITIVLFDYGGVLATEGFRQGLKRLAQRFDLEPEQVYREGSKAVYDSGYVVGQGTEADFWHLLSERTGLPAYREWFTETILDLFRLRPKMLETVRRLNRRGLRTMILSDQTDWLERLNHRDHFFGLFERVFNSYHLGQGKKDPQVFDRVVAELGADPEAVLFIDDHEGHVERARSRGLEAWVFTGEKECLRRLKERFGLP